MLAKQIPLTNRLFIILVNQLSMRFVAVLPFAALVLSARYSEESCGPVYENTPVISCQDRTGLRCNPSIGLDCCPGLDCTADCAGCWGYVSDLLYGTSIVADVLQIVPEELRARSYGGI
jgi:hypothetical protein